MQSVQKEKITLTEESYSVLSQMDLSEIEEYITLIPEEHAFETTDIEEVEVFVDGEIVVHGFDIDYNVTPYGRKMYALYDEIYEQAQ